MKKRLLLLCAIATITLPTLIAQPQIAFKNATHNFGDIKETDGLVSHVFEFTNTGDAPLIIQRVSSSCGCTTPKWTQKPVEPGQKGIVKATFNPRGRPGGFSKSITVYSNVKTQYTRLTIAGNVIPRGQENQLEANYPISLGAIRLNSQTIRMNNVSKGKKTTKVIGVMNASTQNITIDTDKLPKTYQVEVQPKTLKPNQTGSISITFDSNQTDEWGNTSTTIQLQANGKKIEHPNNQINVSANIVEDFSQMSITEKREAPITEIKSTNLQFGNIRQGKKIRGKIDIKNVGINTLHIRKIHNTNKEITIIPQHSSIEGGKQAKIRIYIDSKNLPKGTYQKSFSIQTNDPITTNIAYTLYFSVI